MPDNKFMQNQNQSLSAPIQRLEDVKEVKDSWVAPKLGTVEQQRNDFNARASESIADSVFENINRENEQKLAQGLIARADANPARYLHAVKTADALGFKDYDLVYDNLDEFEKHRKEQEKERHIRYCSNLADMCIDDQTLLAKLDDVSAAQLARINDNMVIYGRAEGKTGISGRLARAKYTFDRAEQDFETNELAYDLIGTSGAERAEKLRLLQEAEAKLEDMPELDTSGWSIGDLTLNAVEQLPYQLRTTGAMAAGTVGGAVAGLAASPAGAVVAGYAGNVAGRAAALYNGYKAESGSMARELLRIRDADGKPLDDDIVDVASRFYGGFSSAIEQIGAEGMLKAFGLGNIIRIGLKSAIKEAIKDKTKREIFIKIAKDFTGAITSEGAEEFMQQLLQSGVERTAKDFARMYRGDNYEADDFVDGLIEDFAEAGEAGIQGAKASIVMAGVPTAARAGYAAMHSRVKETKAKADMQILDNTQKQVQAYAESPAFEPKTLNALFQRTRRQSIYQDIFVSVEDAKALMLSEAMQKNKEALTKNGLWADMERQISEGETLGTPVRIGFADFGEKVMPSPELYAAWKDVIKTYEDGVTLKEIREKEQRRANWLAEGQKRVARKDADFEYAYKMVLENSAYAGISDQPRREQAELAAGLMCYMAEQSNTNIQEFVNRYAPQFEVSLNGEVGSDANVQGIIQAVRDEAINNETKNLINVSKRIARKDINAIKKLLLSKIDNPNTADVKKYVQIVNAISDMKLNIEGMSDEDIINHLAEYTKSGELKLDIKRDDADRAKSGLYSASETALADIQATTGGGDYVLVGGGRVPVNYEIVELNDMVTSHDDAGAVNANYPQELQPRDRSRSASDMQIVNIVNNFAPERVARAEIATEGAPIVTKEGFVAVGNGRAMAIRQVYNNEPAAQRYKDYLTAKGFDLTGFSRPVLVRRLTMDMNSEQLKALVDDANTSGTMQYSDSENALRDAAKMSGNLIDLLDIDADIDSAANKRFLNGFFAEVVPTAERNAYLDKDDKITRKGIERVENALVAKLLPDARFLSVLVENPDNNIRKVTKSLAKAAPAIIGFENDIAAGRVNADYSIAADVAGAVEVLKRAKDKGVSATDFIKMTDMFESPISSSTQAMVQLFENTSGAADFLNKMLNYIHNASDQGDLEQGSMFATEPMTKLQLLEMVNTQGALFQLPKEALDIAEKISRIDAERLAFERKDINPELKGRENEKVKAVEINRFFANRKSSKEISIDEVMAAVDANVGKNKNGVRVLKNSATGETATLSNSAISKMFDTTRSRQDGNIGGILGKECIANIGRIFDTALLIKTTPDAKHGTKNRIRRYANAIVSDGETFMVKITVKEMANKRLELTDIEIENNGGTDLAAYDLKVGRKNTAVDAFGNLTADKSAVSSGNNISIDDLIKFVNTYAAETIQIDGKEKAVRNSAGERIARTEEGLRAFYEWFGDSKVVDENGRPLVVYHGGKKGIKSFSNKYATDENMFFFTSNQGLAEDYRGYNESDLNNTDIYPVYLRIKNPLILLGRNDLETMAKIIHPNNDNLQQEWLANETKYVNEYIRQPKDWAWYMGSLALQHRQSIKDHADKNGYDGVFDYEPTARGAFDESYKGFIVFEPNQIKSVYNRGSFSRTTDKIYYQRQRGDNLTGDLFNTAQNNVNNTKPIPLSVRQQVDDLFSLAEKNKNIKKDLPLFSTAAKKIDKIYVPTKQIEDVGDSLLGNLKRDHKVYSWAELENMNDLLRKKYVTKNYIYPRPSIEALREQGLSGRAAAVVLFVYSSINAKPAKGYAETLQNQKRYFDIVQRTMEKTVEYAKAHISEINAWTVDMAQNNDILHAVFPSDETVIGRIFRGNKEYNSEALIAGGNKFINSMMISRYDLPKIDELAKAVESDKKADNETDATTAAQQPVWHKYFQVHKSYDGTYFVADAKSAAIYSRNLSFTTYEEAYNFAEQLYQRVLPYLNQGGDVVDFSDMRKGLPRRENGQNVNAQALVDTFGFRGINFGNWTKQQERQEFLNLTYDSLLDMSEILGIPPRAIGLEGKLGLAFGAQGRSSAAGHFIPEFNEINLTRKNGAGSLAHEWWHALDYYFGDQALNKDFSGTPVLELSVQGNLRTETYEAIRQLYDTIATADIDDADLERRRSAREKQIRYNIDYRAKEIKNKFARAKNAAEIAEYIDGLVALDKNYDDSQFQSYVEKMQNMVEPRRRTADLAGIFMNLLYHLKQLNKLDEASNAWKKASEYVTKAQRLNKIAKGHGANYWTERTELGARAFASYIQDKISGNGWYNYFLAGHAKGSVFDMIEYLSALGKAQREGGTVNIGDFDVQIYPANETERNNINAAFDKLFNTIKVDPENNYRLYQEVGTDALGAYIPLERKIVLFRGHNLSTIIHETGHWWLDVLSQVAQTDKASDKLRQDWATIKDWLGVSDDNIISTEQHEKFARGVEAYFMTRKAPSSRLAQLFDTFRRWLAGIYKDVKELDVDLNDDVVRVFDHMLASEAEIEEYRQANRLKEMFDRADTFGLSDKDFEKYREMAESSLTLAQNKHFNDKMLFIYREEQEAYAKEKERLAALVRNEWCEDKYNRALYAIYRGKVGDIDVGEITLNEAEMRDLFGDDLTGLPKRDGKAIYAADGMDLQTVADFVGLTPEELKGTLLSARKRVRKYKEMLDRRTHEELGDPVSYDDVQKQVVASIYNDKQASLLRFELNTIGKSLGRKSVLEQAYDAYARHKIENMTIKDLKPQAYAEQAQRAGDKALQAMERGNRNEAYRQKEMQIRNFYLYREAQKQLDVVEKAVKRLKQIGKKEVNTGVDQTYQDAARALLSKVDLARALNSKQKERLGNLAMWVMEQRQNGYEIVVPDKFLHEINRVNYTELTVDDFLSLTDSVKSLIHNGRAIKEFELAGQLVDREALLAEMNKSLKKFGRLQKSRSSRKTFGETAAKFWRGMDSFLTGLGYLANRVDGGDTNGVFHKTFVRPLSEAQTLENDLKVKYANKIADLTAGLSKETKAKMRDYVPEAEQRLGGKYTLEDLITIGLNMGNKDNLQRLKDGNGFSDNQLNWVKNYLTQEHWDYIQAIWDVLESMYPMLEEHHKKMSGLDMDKVFPIPVQTNYGQYRGGYFPIVYDREFSPDMEAKAALYDADYNVATTSKGYTKQRLNKVNAPIKLGLMNVAQHINTVLHDVAYRGTLRKLWTLANNAEFVEMFDNSIGKEYREGINDLLKMLGNEPNRETRGLAAWEKCLQFIRRRATLIGLGFRITTALSQPLGFFSSIATMTEHKQKQGGQHGGAYYIALSHKELMTNPKLYDWARACSGELRARLGNQDASIAKRIKELTKNAGNMTFKEQAETWAYKAIGYMDYYVSTVTWVAAYRQATTDFKMNHEDAVFYADRVMLNSQGTGSTKDTAAIQRANEGWRALTMFYSFFSALYQTSVQMARDVKTAKTFKEYADLSARFMAMFVLPSCLDSLMRGEAPDGDEDSWFAWLFDNVFGYFIGGVPILRDVYSGLKYHNSGSSNVGRQVNYFGNFANAIGKAFDGDPNWQKISKNALNSFAVVTGYPTGGQIADTASYFVGVAAGEIEPHSMADILWGIYKGKERE